jgi:hypothetical protein
MRPARLSQPELRLKSTLWATYYVITSHWKWLNKKKGPTNERKVGNSFKSSTTEKERKKERKND